MNEPYGTININYVDNEINSLISSNRAEEIQYTRHFNHNEEFFLCLKTEYIVPQISIHHDVAVTIPHKDYLDKIKEVLEQLLKLAPHIFLDVTYFFNPAENLKIYFFRLYRMDEERYLYLFSIDLSFKAQDCIIIDKGTNDLTPRYRTRQLFVDALMVPLKDVLVINNKIHSFIIHQTISDTWIDEEGDFYHKRGIWIDQDLTKFFSKVFLQKDKNIYPFYPFVCRYNTMCQFMIKFMPEHRTDVLPYLHRAIRFLDPYYKTIHAEIVEKRFSEDLNIYQCLKTKLSAFWNSFYDKIKIEVYLNHNDMREFRVEF
jgi:hypothetical protein